MAALVGGKGKDRDEPKPKVPKPKRVWIDEKLHFKPQVRTFEKTVKITETAVVSPFGGSKRGLKAVHVDVKVDWPGGRPRSRSYRIHNTRTLPDTEV